jgi:hypothetical protein
MNTFFHVGRAGNLFANGVTLPNLASASLVRFLAADAVPVARLADAAAGARIEAALVTGPFPVMVLLARDAVGLADPLAALPLNRLHRGYRLAHGTNAVLVASLDHVLVASLADFLHDRFGHRPAHRAAHFLDALLINRFAHGVAALAAMLFTDLLLDAIALLVAVLFVAWFADRIAAFFPAGFRNLFADGIVAFFPAGLVDRLAAGLLHGFIGGFVARFVASLALFAIASLANLLHDGFLDGLVAGVPPFLQDRVVHQLVARAALVVTRRETTLRLTTRLAAAGVLVGAAMRCSRALDRPEQAD